MKWFHHDLSTRDSDQIWELIDKHGVQGYGLWWVVLEECYSSENSGFQVEASETWFKKLSKELNLSDWRTLTRVLDTMAEVGLIDSQLWADHVIHVPGIQSRADEYVKKKSQNALRQAAYRAKRREEKSRVTNASLTPTSEKSRASNVNNRDVTPSEIRDQRSEFKDQISNTQIQKPCVVKRENPLLKVEDRWAARKENRKDSPFDLAWAQYQRNCIVVDRSPGSRTQASLAWAERFPEGPTPEFLESLDVYWQQQLEKFKLGQECVGVVGMLRFLTEPEHAERAIARQQLLAQAPQIADPKTFAEATKAQAEDDMWAAIKAKGGAA